MNPLGAMQRYAILALVLIVAGGLYGGWQRHQGVKQGEAAGNARVASLEAQYAQAHAAAQVAARAAQAKADAEAMAQARAQAAAGQQAAQAASTAADDARSRLALIRQRLDEESSNDATLAAWRAARRPAATLGLHPADPGSG